MSTMALEDSPQISLGAEMRSVARTRILRAAREVLVRQGVGSTVDDIATAAGVSRRTVFRYFPSAGQLVAAAIAEIMDDFATQLPTAPEPGADIDAWLVETAIRMHRFHAERVGRVFWDLHPGVSETMPELAEVLATRDQLRRGWRDDVTLAAWRGCGGLGTPPPWVAHAFFLLFSPFAYNGLATSDDLESDETARISAKTLSAVLAKAVVGDARR